MLGCRRDHAGREAAACFFRTFERPSDELLPVLLEMLPPGLGFPLVQADALAIGHLENGENLLWPKLEWSRREKEYPAGTRSYYPTELLVPVVMVFPVMPFIDDD